MKKIIILLAIIISSFEINAQKVNYENSPIEINVDDKLAIVMVHFGSTNEASRGSYDRINSMVANEFAQADIFDAYSSRIVINLLKRKGIEKQTPREVFEELVTKGYTHIVVQSTHIIDGVEMESLREDLKAVEDKFKVVRIGNPILYSESDYRRVAEAMTTQIESQSDAIVLVGHGTYTPITSSYAMMDYTLKLMGYNNWHVSTIEGYPTLDNTIELLSRADYKSVTLAPFMYIAGVHAQEDIAGEWREELEARGYEVDLLLVGMGDNVQIQKIVVDHIHFAMENRHLDIMEKKRGYANSDNE